MKEFLKKLIAERARVHAELKALVDDSDNGERRWGSDEEQKFENLSAALDDLDNRIEAMVREIEREDRTAEARAAAERFIRPNEDPKPATDANAFFKAWLKGEQDTPKGFDVSLRGISVERAKDGLLTVRADLNTTDDNEVVPLSFRRQLYEHLIENSAIRQTRAEVFTTASGEPLTLPKTTAHGGATIVPEGSAIPEDDPTFGSVVLGAFKYGKLIQVTTEMVQDEAVNLLGYLARKAGEAIGNDSGEDFIVGTGTDMPRGVITAGSLAVTSATPVATAFPAADDLIDLFYSLKEPYQRNAEWLLRGATVGKIRKLKDANNQYLWQPGIAGDRPNTLLDRPYVLDPNVPAAAAGATAIAVGDFSTYVIRDVASVRFERSDDFAFDKDLVTFRALLRSDGDLTDETGAIATYKGGAS